MALGASEVWLILPTYNEALNLEPIVEAAREHLPAGSRILIVDDNSPDGTGQVADRLAREADDLEVLHRPREGGPRSRLHRRLSARAGRRGRA